MEWWEVGSPGGLSAGLPVPGQEARSGSREGEERSRERMCSRRREKKGWAACWVERSKKAEGWRGRNVKSPQVEVSAVFGVTVD